MNTELEKNDYTDPICPFDFSQYKKEKPVMRIPCERIEAKEDEYFYRKDYAGAERHLRYWLSEAEAGNDLRGAFFIQNELMGFYRKTGRREEAFQAMEAALRMTECEEIGPDSQGAGTACLNAATVCKAFSEPERAKALYEKARVIYERELMPGDPRFGGLYNNLALALTDLGAFDEAVGYYKAAVNVMEKTENGKGDAAISCLNLCDTLMRRDGSYVNDKDEPCDASDPEAYLSVPSETDAEIEEWLDRAESFLLDPTLRRDGYFSYVVEKCAPVLRYYGREEAADTLLSFVV